MSYLFYIDEKNNCVLHPEVIKLCPSLKVLNEKELLYVILYADYSSIYKQYPEHERKRKAIWHAFGDNETELVEEQHILHAIEDYISLQYNRKIEVIRGYERKIDDFLSKLEGEDNPAAVKKLDEAIDSLQKRINSMQMEVNEKILDEGVLKGGRVKSFLEKIMSNRKYYETIIGKKLP
ncbi:conserved hypothetical protein [Gammaproteobacteria bacterium]|tara:strand:+ start:492 stop:1028 length:537 start_codon:yes stop_codon:yes gene_type:complete